MNRFVVGEVAVVARSHYVELPVGMEVTITQVFGPEFFATRLSGEQWYALHDGWCIVESHLRKRRPPQDWVTLCKLEARPVEVA